MKKFLSIILAVTMIMSLICVMPVSADVGNKSYYFYTFEDGNYKIGSSTGHSAQVVAGGVNGSAYATQINVSNGHVQSSIADTNGIEVKAGDILRGSMWMKLPAAQHADSKAIASLLLFANKDAADGATGKIEGSNYKFISVAFDKNSTDWQKVTWEYVFKEDHIKGKNGSMYITIRMNPNGGGNKAVDNTDPKNPVATDNCSYLVDDLEIKIGKEFVPQTSYNFTNHNANTFKAGGLIQNHSVQSDPLDSTNKAYKFEFKPRTLVSENTDAKAHIHGSNYGTFNWYANRAIKTGEKITVSLDVYVEKTYYSSADMLANIIVYPRNTDGKADFTEKDKYQLPVIDMTKVGQWQTVTVDLGTATADSNFYNYYIFIRSDAYVPEGNELYQEGTAEKNGKAFVTYALSETVMYIDNLKVDIESNVRPIPVVTDATATMAVDTGVVTPAYTYTTAAAAIGSELSADASYFKLLDGDKVLASFAKSDVITVPEDYRTSRNLKLTIVPYSEAGYFGEEVTVSVAMPELPEPEPVIELIADDGQVIIFTDTYIENARLIFASYDANDKMVDVEVRDNMSISVDAPEAYSPADLESGATTVAMLWTDFDSAYKPMTASVSW